MDKYVTLLGTEGVERAGHNMRSAAEEFSRNVAWLEESLQRHRNFMDDWLQRFEQVVTASTRSAK